MRRVVAFCMGITLCHRRKFGQVWGSTAPLPEVAGKLRCRKASLWTFGYHTEKSESFCDVTPGLYRLVTVTSVRYHHYHHQFIKNTCQAHVLTYEHHTETHKNYTVLYTIESYIYPPFAR